MQTNLLWTGREYHSLENCLVITTNEGFEIDSVIVGTYREKIYRVGYKIRTNYDWRTTFVEIHSQHSNRREHIKFEGDGQGNWVRDGENAGLFKDCIDIDIPLTPLTNTLPVNRLKLSPGAAQEIKVLYIDLLEQQIMPVRQKYIRLSEREYLYENVPNDFEAKIEVDSDGFVVDYPKLFVRSAKLASSYD